MLRRLLRGFVVLLAAIAVLLVAGLAIVETAWFKDRLRVYAVERAAPYLNGELEIGRLEGSLFRGVELHDVAIRQQGTDAVRADAITVRYDPLRLWRDGLAFDAIAIERPDLHLVQNASGGWNLANLVRSRGTSGGGATFRIDALTVRDARVTIDPSAGEPRRLADVDVTGELAYTARELSIEVESFHGIDERTGWEIDRLTGSFADGFHEIDATFAAHAGNSRVEGRVTGNRTDGGRRLEAAIDVARLDLARLLQRPSLESDITGHADLEAVIPSQAGETARANYVFRGPAVSALGYAAQAVDVAGEVDGGRVTFKGGAAAYGARATVDGAWRFSSPAGDRTGLTARGTFADVNLRRLPDHLEIPPLDSRLTGRYAVRVLGGDVTADTTLATSTVEGAILEEGTRGRLTRHGERFQYEAAGNLRALNPARLANPLELPVLAGPRFDGQLTGSFRASGRHAEDRRHLAVDALLEASTLGGTTFSGLDLHVERDDERLLVGVRGAFEGLTGRLAGLPDTVSMTLDGTADATVVIHEIGAPLTPEALDIIGTVALGPSEVRGVSISSASLTGTLEDGLVTLESASVESPALQATATGTAALGPNGESNLEVLVLSQDLRPLGEILGRPLSGTAELKAHVTGPASEPRAAGTLNAQSLAYGDAVSALTMETTFEASMPGREIAGLGVHASSEGTFVKAGNFEFVRVGLMADYANKEFVLETRLEEEARTLDLAGIVTVEPDARRVRLRRLAVGTAAATWTTIPGREARIDLDPDRVTISDLVLGRGEQQVAIGGTLPLETPVEATGLDLQLTAIQLADVNSLMLGERTLTGVANGRVRVDGTFEAPAVDATVTITQGSVEGVGFERVQADVEFAEGLATVEAVLDQALNAQLSVSGTVPIRAPATESRAGMDLKVTSTPVSLGLAQAFTTELSAIQGTGVFDLQVTGTFDAPVVNGSMNVDGVGFSVASTGVDYRNGVARLRFADNRLQIDQFSLTDENDHLLQVAGGVDLTGRRARREFNVTFMADGFSVLDNDLGVMRIDALFTAQGDFAAPRLSGDVRVSEGRIEVDRLLELTTSNVYSTTPQGPIDEAAPAAPSPAGAAEPPQVPPAPPTAGIAKALDQAAAPPAGDDEEPSDAGLLSRVELDLRLRLPDNLVLRGRDLRTAGSPIGLGDMNIIAGGELTIRKPPTAPTTLVGSLEIVRGYYSFQGRRFDVQPESAVRFQGQTPIDPALNVGADRAISGVVASVEIRGTLRQPEIALSSDPPLDEADLLALIVFGQPVNELGVAQRTSLSERAAMMAAGAVATPVADAVAQALNLDLFEIQASSPDAAAVMLGSQIGSRLYVGVRQQVGRSDASALSLEYRVADFLRFVTTIVHGAGELHAIERREESGADMIFTWRY